MDKVNQNTQDLYFRIGLWHALSALALAGRDQIDVIDDPRVSTADELALEFDEAVRPFTETRQIKLSDSDLLQLQRLANALHALSKNKAVWADDALIDWREWNEIRTLAAQALSSLGLSQVSTENLRRFFRSGIVVEKDESHHENWRYNTS